MHNSKRITRKRLKSCAEDESTNIRIFYNYNYSRICLGWISTPATFPSHLEQFARRPCSLFRALKCPKVATRRVLNTDILGVWDILPHVLVELTGLTSASVSLYNHHRALQLLSRRLRQSSHSARKEEELKYRDTAHTMHG